MSDSVVIVGPASPKALAALLSESERDHALAIPGLGGTPVNNLVSALLDADISVELVTLAPELTERVTLEGRRLRILVGPYRPRARHRARDFFRAERQQVSSLVQQTYGRVVHAHWTCEFALGALGRHGRPTIVTAHDAPLTILRHQLDLYRAMRTAMSVATRLRAPTLAANSPYLASAWRYQMLYRQPITVLPNVVIPVSGPSAKEIADMEGMAPTILDVSNEGASKNVGALVQAMPRILSSYPNARLRLVGPGLTHGSTLARLAEQLGIGRSVEFAGLADPAAVREAYEEATVFVHPSLEESFGMSVAEAMSHSLPVVACAGAGAVPWVLGKGSAGLLVDARCPDTIADAVCRLLGDVRLRADLGAAAVQRTRSMFSPAAVATSTLQLYDDVEAAAR